jgi:glutamate 5-kinase
MNRIIIVKIGTESLTNFHTSEKVTKMVADIARLIREKISVVLVSSGAVWCGREIMPYVTSKQALASFGQHELMNRYAKKFKRYKIKVGQVLPTHASVEEIASHRTQFIMTVQDILDGGGLPIVNENDALSTAEMRELWKWADNDRNALLVARILGSREIVLITNTNGIYANLNDSRTRIDTLCGLDITDEWIQSICGEKSGWGTGGAPSKLQVWKTFAEHGGITHICNGLESGVYEHIMEREVSGWTRIVP